MFTFARQVRQASEHAFGAGRAAGVAVPELPAIDNSFAEMKARIDKTIDCLKGLKADQLDGREDAQVTITQGGQPRNFRAQNYLYHLAMPNFYFHTTTAHNILRSLGVEIGKRDLMGQMPSYRLLVAPPPPGVGEGVRGGGMFAVRMRTRPTSRPHFSSPCRIAVA